MFFFVSLTWGFYRFELNSTFDWKRGAEFMRAHCSQWGHFPIMHIIAGSQALASDDGKSS